MAASAAALAPAAIDFLGGLSAAVADLGERATALRDAYENDEAVGTLGSRAEQIRDSADNLSSVFYGIGTALGNL